MKAQLGGLRAMGRPSKPSAYSLTLIGGEDKVTRAIADVRGIATEAAGARPDQYAPLPHITVARPGRSAPSGLLDQAARWVEDTSPIGVEVRFDEVALYTWAKNRKQRLFDVVKRAPLRR